MKRFSKISIDDIKTIQVDSGVLLKEFDVENPVFLPENVICATSGGINHVCAPEYYDFGEDVDNAKTAKETKRIRGWNVSISFTTFTTSLDLIRLALGAADISGKVLSIRQKLQYAKDFKDIWWVGERADGIIVAIKLIRSLSDSGFSLQTNKRGKGQISVTLKGHSSFAEKDKIPMEVYIFAESDIPIVPDEPDTPTTAMYLYGTPSKVSYNGVELPDIEGAYVAFAEANDITVEEMKEVVPYAVIMTSEASKYLYFLGFELSIDANGKLNNSVGGAAFVYWSHKGSWVMCASQNIDAGGFATDPSNCIWTSHDILNADGSVYLAATEPVHSGNIGLRSGDSVTLYDGAVLPELPEYDEETYPYALMDKKVDRDGNIVRRRLYFFACNAYYSEGGAGLLYFGGNTEDGEQVALASYELTDGVWVFRSEVANGRHPVYPPEGFSPSGDPASSSVYFTEWSNFKIEYNGTFYREKCEYIPVGENAGNSYNGTVLPVLPEWDKEAYPYAAIIKTLNGYVFAARATVFATRLDTTVTAAADIKYLENEGTWTTTTLAIAGEIEWANHDVYVYDDTSVLVLAASDPIPVYDKE